jgi:hypothetical protein
MAIDLTDMEGRLSQTIGEMGLNYLAPQLEIIRQARNLPKNIDDTQLHTGRFYLALNVIKDWLAPVAEISQILCENEEEQILELQERTRTLITSQNIHSWYDVVSSSEIKSLFDYIGQRVQQLEEKKQQILSDFWRHQISNLVGITLYPYAVHGDNSFENALELARAYIGPNVAYRKQNIYVDSLILQKVSEDTFQKEVDAKKIVKAIKERIPTMGFSRTKDQEEWDLFRISQGTKGNFSPSHAEGLAKNMLNLPRLTDEIRKDLQVCYIPELDRFSIPALISWLSSKPEIASLIQKESVHHDPGKVHRPRYILGLAFMDHHRRSDILGNIPEAAANLFEQMMGPFNELKQQDAFMQSANFQIDAFGLPPIVWLYDFLGVKSEILRSTLLLISERQPKFDILESCQRLANAVLGGRVDRNSYREKGDNYFQVNHLPQSTWDYVSNQVAKILEETLVDEEDRALRILRSVFVEEDRSQLVTSKKFLPAFQLDFTFSEDEITKRQDFLEVSIFAREGFAFDSRHVQAGGYPWYLQVNSILESLVVEALRVPNPAKVHGNVNLKQVVFKRIEDKSFLVHYERKTKKALTVMGFREAELTEEATSAVEILHRARKFLDRTPEKNKLNSLLEGVRATDPKDLYAIIASL